MKTLSMRDKGYWANLTKEECTELMFMQMSPSSGGSAWNAPEGTQECGVCGDFSTSGWCRYHLERFIELDNKARGSTPTKEGEGK